MNVSVNRSLQVDKFVGKHAEPTMEAVGELGVCQAVTSYGLRLMMMATFLESHIRSWDADLTQAQKIHVESEKDLGEVLRDFRN